MKSIKIMVSGLLVCLIALYLMGGAWGSLAYGFGGYGFWVGVVITIFGLRHKEE